MSTVRCQAVLGQDRVTCYYKLPLNRVLVSVIYQFRGNREFPRLRIGIGKPPGPKDPKAFLLQKFNVAAQQRIDSALQDGVDVLKVLLSKGLTECKKV